MTTFRSPAVIKQRSERSTASSTPTATHSRSVVTPKIHEDITRFKAVICCAHVSFPLWIFSSSTPAESRQLRSPGILVDVTVVVAVLVCVEVTLVDLDEVTVVVGEVISQASKLPSWNMLTAPFSTSMLPSQSWDSLIKPAGLHVKVCSSLKISLRVTSRRTCITDCRSIVQPSGDHSNCLPWMSAHSMLMTCPRQAAAMPLSWMAWAWHSSSVAVEMYELSPYEKHWRLPASGDVVKVKAAVVTDTVVVLEVVTSEVGSELNGVLFWVDDALVVPVGDASD